MPIATHLECSLCHNRLDAGRKNNLCACGGPLLVRYDLDKIRQRWRRRDVRGGPASMWRYAPLLPPAAEAVVSLGEGWTPLLRSRRLGARLGADALWFKDEGLNPAASFKARGLACAVSMCVELGISRVAIASAGNAAGALAAYAAAAGMEAHIFLPKDVPQSNFLECRAYGAEVTLVDGLIGDCGRLLAERAAGDWFDVSTLQEPYRVEGKKTMGYEVAEQMDWELPDAILCPAGGGMCLIGMWKAFDEMERLGWIGSRRPRMIAVQAEGCQPIVRAFEEDQARARFWEDARTVAAGLRVPKPLGDFLILDILRASGGAAVAVSDAQILDAGAALASEEGIYAAPEAAACVAALPRLLASGLLKSADRIVIFNTGSGLKYAEAYATRFPRPASGEQDKLGGLITPR
ncbi:MAG: threonine synthase [Bryobacteraceae bacterium]